MNVSSDPKGDDLPGDGPVISYGSGLGVGWYSHRAGTMKIKGKVGFLRVPVYVNTRVPTSLPTWPQALSLRPDLSERVN